MVKIMRANGSLSTSSTICYVQRFYGLRGGLQLGLSGKCSHLPRVHSCTDRFVLRSQSENGYVKEVIDPKEAMISYVKRVLSADVVDSVFMREIDQKPDEVFERVHEEWLAVYELGKEHLLPGTQYEIDFLKYGGPVMSGNGVNGSKNELVLHTFAPSNYVSGEHVSVGFSGLGESCAVLGDFFRPQFEGQSGYEPRPVILCSLPGHGFNPLHSDMGPGTTEDAEVYWQSIAGAVTHAAKMGSKVTLCAHSTAGLAAAMALFNGLLSESLVSLEQLTMVLLMPALALEGMDNKIKLAKLDDERNGKYKIRPIGRKYYDERHKNLISRDPVSFNLANGRTTLKLFAETFEKIDKMKKCDFSKSLRNMEKVKLIAVFARDDNLVDSGLAKTRLEKMFGSLVQVHYIDGCHYRACRDATAYGEIDQIVKNAQQNVVVQHKEETQLGLVA